MQGRKKYLKFLAFVPAIVLGGGFIGYRAGAFELFSKPEPQPDPQPTASPQPPDAPPASEKPRTYMPGSKFIYIDLKPPGEAAPTAVVPPNSPPEKPPAIFYGSKSAPIVIPGPAPAGNPTPPAPNPPKP